MMNEGHYVRLAASTLAHDDDGLSRRRRRNGLKSPPHIARWVRYIQEFSCVFSLSPPCVLPIRQLNSSGPHILGLELLSKLKHDLDHSPLPAGSTG
jgi:hypothetical protein